MAGVYPVGMATAATWYPQGLGKAIGFLVASLVMGTGFPHFLLALGDSGKYDCNVDDVQAYVRACADSLTHAQTQTNTQMHARTQLHSH